jgi:hypothetical protein
MCTVFDLEFPGLLEIDTGRRKLSQGMIKYSGSSRIPRTHKVNAIEISATEIMPLRAVKYSGMLAARGKLKK